MSSKISETADLRALQRIRPELQITLVNERESPDFIIMSGSRCVGVEHTRFSRPVDDGYPNAHEQAALQARVVMLASQMYESEGKRPLHLEVEFDDYPPLSKKRVPQLARELAHLAAGLRGPLIDYRKQVFPSIDRDYLPEIARITGLVIGSSSKTSWLRAGRSWPARAGEESIMRVIAAKENRLAAYREACPEVWLLIVFKYQAGRFQVKPPIETGVFSVVTGFDRVFCLDPVGDRCVELPTCKPTLR
jgi:hypothetical protein